jgi:ribonuclease J
VLLPGSQGEEKAQLSLASFKAASKLKLNQDDLLLYSAKCVPGNEKKVTRMLNRIAGLGVKIVQGAATKLHASGHAYQDELTEVMR